MELSLEPGYEVPMGSPEELRALGRGEGLIAGSWRTYRGLPNILGAVLSGMRKGSAAGPVASREEKIRTEKCLSVGRTSSACSWGLPGNKQPENECETESRGDGRRL